MEKNIIANQERVPLSWLPKPDNNTISVEASTESVVSVSESRRENVTHGADGKFLPGNPGNPQATGRPPSVSVTEAIKADLRAGKAEVVKDKLFSLMDSARRESVQLGAIQEIIDRSEGKATQNVRHAGVFMVMAPGAEALAALDSWAEEE